MQYYRKEIMVAFSMWWHRVGKKKLHLIAQDSQWKFFVVWRQKQKRKKSIKDFYKALAYAAGAMSFPLGEMQEIMYKYIWKM